VSRPERVGALVVRDVTVVDVEAGELRPGRSVRVEDGTIRAVVPTEHEPSAGGARVVDGRGRFLVPGLWDMHAHYLTKDAPTLSMPLHVAHGVTGVRDLCSDSFVPEDPVDPTIDDFRGWRAAIERGELLGPRLLALASSPLDGPDDLVAGAPAFYGAATEEDARRLVHWLVDRGVDFAKVYSRIPRAGYVALTDEAARVGLPVAGHKPFAVSGVEAARAGQRSIEHALEVLFDLFPGGAELRDPATPYFPPTPLRRRMVDEHDPELADELFAAMVEHGTALTPTHITRRFDARAADPALLDDPRLRFVPAWQQGSWRDDAARMAAIDPSPGGRAAFADFHELGLDLVGRAHRAGVRVLAGTDANDSHCFPGSGLHEELEELVRAGLTPADALRAATLEGARFLGVADRFGTVEPGRAADLVLLDADPLESIGNVGRVAAVVLGGRLLDRAELDDLVEGVARAAAAQPELPTGPGPV
jgi:hypothetical protein